MATRREFLKLGALAGACATLPLDRVSALAASKEPFQVPLSVPPVLKPVRSNGERDLYVTTMRKAYAEILPGRKTPVWAFNGRFPGPTIKVKRGRKAVVRRKNRLDVPATTHLHGAAVPWQSDGHPSLLVRPGDVYDYVYPNEQPAATLWYHDHTCHHTSRNNYMGLSGLYIIEDDAEEELNLPKDKYDIPLVLQDRSFRKGGAFRFKDHHDEVLGGRYLVNGRPTPFLKVANRKYRFRIVNASHTRGYQLALDNGEPLVQIATDQGLLPAPAPAANIPLWPAERAEVVIDFARYPVGTKIILQDREDPNDATTGRPVMQFEVAREESDDSSLPATLAPFERLLPGLSTVQREFNLSQDVNNNRWVINGKPFDASRIDIKPRLGDTEVWTFRNNSSVTHPMHIHLIRFQILDRSNMSLSASDTGWKDTVRVDPAATVRVIMRFEGYTGRYMYHCHNLAHEDHSMMGQMKVVSPDGKQRSVSGSPGGFVSTAGVASAEPATRTDLLDASERADAFRCRLNR